MRRGGPRGQEYRYLQMLQVMVRGDLPYLWLVGLPVVESNLRSSTDDELVFVAGMPQQSFLGLDHQPKCHPRAATSLSHLSKMYMVSNTDGIKSSPVNSHRPSVDTHMDCRSPDRHQHPSQRPRQLVHVQIVATGLLIAQGYISSIPAPPGTWTYHV